MLIFQQLKIFGWGKEGMRNGGLKKTGPARNIARPGDLNLRRADRNA
jgi:hypothetical protein